MTIAEMAKSGYAQAVPKDSVIFRENEAGDRMYIVLKGSVSITVDVQGNELKVADIEQGGFFGEMSLLEGLKRTATAVASVDCVLLVITKDNFDKVIAGNPEMAIKIMRGLSGRIRRLNDQLKESVRPQRTLNPSQEKDITQDYVLEKEVTCPACDHQFKEFQLRNSKLKVIERNGELRTFCEDIDPTHFKVLVCPNCYYARAWQDFDQVIRAEQKLISASAPMRKGKYKLSELDKAAFALQAHHLAIECYGEIKKGKVLEKQGGLWLGIAWLLDDMQQTKAAIEAREQALAKYKEAFEVGTEDDQTDFKVEYLIGKLSAALGNYEEARNYFFRAASRRQGNSIIKEMARDQLQVLKQVQKDNP